MIPNLKHRALATGGVTESGTFGISHKDSAHIMQILRDQLYSDKVLAVLREYSSNAWDAHRSIGKHDLPIKVTLPTALEPTLSIRDWGPGLSPQEVFEVYTQYGASTKRDDDEAIGMLGIGSKSGFAYSDTFTVISYHGGKKRTYVAVLDKTDQGVINLMNEEPCDLETGVEIQIAVKQEDIREFFTTAEKLFRYFSPRPDINIDFTDHPGGETVLKNGTIFHGDRRDWFAVMGCIPYRINLDQIKRHGNGLQACVQRMGGILNFDIGTVHISASREELKYSDITKAALIEKFNLLVDEYVQQALKTLNDTAKTPWEKRWECYTFEQLQLPLPPAYEPLTNECIEMDAPPQSFFITKGSKAKAKPILKRFTVTRYCRFVIRDDKKPVRGYSLQQHDYVIRRVKNTSLVKVISELDKLLADHLLTGVPVLNISTLPWKQPTNSKGVALDTSKYKAAMFKLVPNELRRWSEKGRAPSHAWEPILKTPEPDDVYMVLHGFKPEGYELPAKYAHDSQLAALCQLQMPPIYGYRSTKYKPVDEDKVVGIDYATWSKRFRVKLLDHPGMKEAITHLQWNKLFERLEYWHHQQVSSKVLRAMKEDLGDQHPITIFLQEGHNRRRDKKVNRDMLQGAETLLKLDPPNQALECQEWLFNRYPLLSAFSTVFDTLWSENFQKWIDYIKLIDATFPRQETP